MQIDAEAQCRGRRRGAWPARHLRELAWTGLRLAGSMVLATGDEFFVRGQDRGPPRSLRERLAWAAPWKTQAPGRPRAREPHHPARRGGLVARRGLQAHGLHQRSRLPLRRLPNDRQAFPRCAAGPDGHHHEHLRAPRRSCSSSMCRCCEKMAGTRTSGAGPTIRAPRAMATWARSFDCEVLHGCEGRAAGDPARPDRPSGSTR